MSGQTRTYPPQRRFLLLLSVLLLSIVGAVAGCDGNGDGKSGNPAPVLTSVSPATAVVGGSGFTLTASGSGFVSGSTVQWNGASRTTTFVSSTQLTASIPAGDIASAGTAQITVASPTPGGGTSSAIAFTIANPVPAISSLSPAQATAGSGAFELTVLGSQFVNGAAVQWNGTARTTTFVSSTELKAAIAEADVATAGIVPVTVVNPGPGGGASAAIAFAVDPIAPVPGLTGLDPAGVTAGSPGFNLVVSGSGFVQGATVHWNGNDRVTTFVSATQLQAAIAAADVGSPISVPVSVTNPAPGGGTSNAIIFNVTAAPTTGAPVPVSIAPDGSPPNGPSLNGGVGISARMAVFASKASNLVPGDTNDAWDVFMRDTCMDDWTGGLIPGCTPTTTRISVAPDGSQADGDSGATPGSPDGPVAVSFSGRYVAFVSAATNLVAGDTNGVEDVFLTDTCTDVWGRPISNCARTTVRVSLRNDGSQSNSPASAPAIGDTGGHVVFVSADPNIVAGDGNGVADVFLRDVCSGSGTGCTPGTRRISVAPGNADANGASGSPAFTGRYVAFTSAATNLVAGDTNRVADVFMRDTCIDADDPCTPSTERISLGEGDVQADGASSEPLVGLPMSSASGYDYHGRFVVFVSGATNLVAGDTNGAADVFMRDTCRGFPACIPSTQRVSLTSTGEEVVGASSNQPGHMRWDGEEVLFVTAASGVVPGDTNGVEDVFKRGVCHDTPTCDRTTTRVSVGDDGIEGNGASVQPRGNYDPWVGPQWATFYSTATSFWPGDAPDPYYGAIFRTTTY
jgi:IPT/TIG domain